MKKIVLGAFLAFFIIGCASKNKEISKQTALSWHKIIFKNLSPFDLDTADDAFTSLEVEHPESQFIPIDMIQLSLAHAKINEFELATFYMQEFKKRYASYEEKEWADYMISKYKFFSIEEPYTNQQGLNDALDFVNTTIQTYPDSIYNYELNTMKAKLEITKKLFRENISELYKRIDKIKAAKIYKTDIDKNNIIPPHIPWYKRMFYW
jgi:outer membrane protein assembly factor BamD